MESTNLFGEDGISICLTADYDMCDATDPEAAIRVIGHKVYASPLEQAKESIYEVYMDRIGMVLHPYHGWIAKTHPAAEEARR